MQPRMLSFVVYSVELNYLLAVVQDQLSPEIRTQKLWSSHLSNVLFLARNDIGANPLINNV